MKVCDIGFGVAVAKDPRLLVVAFHRGVNYFDIVPGYAWSVEMLARAFRLEPRMRKETIVASKAECFGLGSLFTEKSFSESIQHCVDDTLQKLGRDHIDIMQVHGVGEPGRDNLGWLDRETKEGEETFNLFDSLRKQGKVRFSGISSHGPYRLEAIMENAIKSGRFDMIMVALNFMHSPRLKEVLQMAAGQGVGVVAMKVLANARGLGIRSEGSSPFSKAAITWALKQPGVHSVVLTIPNRSHLDEYLSASGEALTFSDRAALVLHRISTSRAYCRVGCGSCLHACPHGVEIPSILRCDQYRRDYGLLSFARWNYSAVSQGRRPQHCLSCTTPLCKGVCPYGVPIRQRLRTALSHLDSQRPTSA